MSNPQVGFTFTCEMTDMYLSEDGIPLWRIRYDITEHQRPWVLFQVVYNETAPSRVKAGSINTTSLKLLSTPQ